MSSYDKLIHIFDVELKTRVDEIISDYAEVISKKHGIPLDLLLRDVPEIYNGLTCKGTKSNGQRCTHKGLHEGYCGKHVTQGNRIKQRNITSINTHTHGPEKLFVPECPACIRSNVFRDISTMFINE
jgi:hypothetical protein